MKIAKLIYIFIISVFICGCGYTPAMYYTSFSDPKVVKKEKIYWGEVFEGGYKSTAMASSSIYIETETNKQQKILRLSIDFMLAAYGDDSADKFCEDKEEIYKSGWDSAALSLSVYKSYFKENGEPFMPIPDIKLDTSKVYLIKNNKKTKLKLRRSKNPMGSEWEYIPYRIADIIGVHNGFRYEIPYVCEELEGVEVEIGGIYINGVEAPPLRFKMNYKDKIKKKFNIN